MRGEQRLYRTWLYRMPKVPKRRRPRPITLLTVGEHAEHPSKAPFAFARSLLAYRPDANPDKYYQWRGIVLHRGGYACCLCGAGKRANLVAHHVIRWVDDERRRYDPSNGVVLCRRCHDAHHTEESQRLATACKTSGTSLKTHLLRPLTAPAVYRNGQPLGGSGGL